MTTLGVVIVGVKMARVRDTLVNFSDAVVTNGEIQKYLIDALRVAVLPGEFGVKPMVVDPLDDATVDVTKWAAIGSAVGEGSYLKQCYRVTLSSERASGAVPSSTQQIWQHPCFLLAVEGE